MDTIISVIGSQYLQPIADLLGAFLKRKQQKSDAVSSGYYEGAYVSSILLLLVAVVESMAARDRHFNVKARVRRHIPVPEYMKELYRYRGCVRLSELYIIRDAIIHNHVWVLQFLTSATGKRKLLFAQREWWSGNDRLAQRLNPRTFRTKRLGLNVIPSRMDRKDLLKAFDVAISFLQFLEKRGVNPVEILRTTIDFQGTRISFLQLRQNLARGV